MSHLILLFLVAFGHADEYLSGHALYDRLQDQVTHELGLFVDVPIDHAHPAAGTTSIYAALPFGFDDAKPSVLVFDGGPGFSCHRDHPRWQMYRNAINVIRMDQRGLCFSRPATQQMYEDPNFYSTENIARDAEYVRKALGIVRWSVIGKSYGSLIATVYGSKFPEHTIAMLMVGTYFSWDTWERAHPKLLNHYLYSAPMKSLVETLRREPDGMETLISSGDNWSQSLDEWVRQSLYERGAYLLPALAHEVTRCFRDKVQAKARPPFKFELDMHLRMIDLHVNQQLLPHMRAFDAAAYPLSVPVTYLQGRDDYNTPPGEAVRHFKIVPRGFAQMVIMDGVAHQPVRPIQSFNVPDASVSLPGLTLNDAILGRDLTNNSDFHCWRALTNAKLITRRH